MDHSTDHQPHDLDSLPFINSLWNMKAVKSKTPPKCCKDALGSPPCKSWWLQMALCRCSSNVPKDFIMSQAFAKVFRTWWWSKCRIHQVSSVKMTLSKLQVQIYQYTNTPVVGNKNRERLKLQKHCSSELILVKLLSHGLQTMCFALSCLGHGHTNEGWQETLAVSHMTSAYIDTGNKHGIWLRFGGP